MSGVLSYTAVGDCEPLLLKHFSTVYPQGFLRCEGTLLPTGYSKFAEEILNFEIRDDDVWVCSFPKTGTTWTQEMVWCIANDLDFEGAKLQHGARFPFLDLEFLVDGVKHSESMISGPEMPRFMAHSIGYIKDTPSPRFIKTHLPYHLLPLQLQRGETGAK
ncbi:aryl sulfotransferase activity protein, partial [Homalodisca vitripennis]